MKELNIPNALGLGKIFYVEENSSTMFDADELARNGCEHGTIVCSGHQNAGRGRNKSRRWEDLPGESLMFTAVLRPKSLANTGLIPLRCGLALSLWLEAFGLAEVKVKWPNDVLVDGKKISGILCESFPQYFLCGIGVNVKQLSFPEFPAKPVSLHQLGIRAEPLDLLPLFLSFLTASMEMDDPLPSLNARLYGKGREAVFSCGPVGSRQTVTGKIEEIDLQGQLILETVEGKRAFGAGEISSNLK